MTKTTEELVQIAHEGLKAEYPTKAAQQTALEDVNRAFEKVRSTVMAQLLTTPHEERDQQWNDLYWGFPSYPHQWSAKVAKLFHKWGWASQTAAELKALRDEIKAAPIAPKVSKPAPAPSVEEGRMTCQCCGRPILANTGTIAHHGYTRPGMGWQTASCEGAKELPFEVSRDALGKYIERLNRVHDQLVARQDTITSGYASSASLFVTDHDQQRTYGQTRRSTLITVTPVTFEERRAELPKTFSSYSLRSFEAVLEREAAVIKGQLSSILSELAQQEVRYNGWSQTHKWSGVAFVPA
jgi:hypothetical protein